MTSEFRLNNLLRYFTEYDLGKAQRYIKFLSNSNKDYIVNMLIVSITNNSDMQVRQLLIDYLEIPNNLTDKEIITYCSICLSNRK